MKSYQRSLQAHDFFISATLPRDNSTWLDYLLQPQYFLGADSSAYCKIPIGNGVRESFRSFRLPSWLGKFQLLFLWLRLRRIGEMLPRFCLQSSGKVLLVLLVITNAALESVVLRVGRVLWLSSQRSPAIVGIVVSCLVVITIIVSIVACSYCAVLPGILSLSSIVKLELRQFFMVPLPQRTSTTWQQCQHGRPPNSKVFRGYACRLDFKATNWWPIIRHPSRRENHTFSVPNGLFIQAWPGVLKHRHFLLENYLNFVDLNICFVCRFQSLAPVHCLLRLAGCFPYLLIHDGELLNLLN